MSYVPQIVAYSISETDSAPPPKPKRKVSYNQDVVLCSVCKKRIRLNNSGRLRLHVAGKIGSDKCVGSDAKPPVVVLTDADVHALADEAEQGYNPSKLIQHQALFSDITG
jgi:hypothetical protein